MKANSCSGPGTSRLPAAVLLLLLSAPFALEGQAPPRYHPGEVTVGSEAERYLRVLQVAGTVERYPWSVRGLTPREVDRLLSAEAAHPWDERIRGFAPPDGRELRTALFSPATRAMYNSDFPFGAGDGPVWAGRGFTGEVQGGFFAAWGPLDVTVAPLAWQSQNDDFALAPTGLTDDGRFRDPRSPNSIDVPQRFGDGSHGEVDPGASGVRLYLPGAVLAFSTAAQQWGPGREYPLLLGNNAGGFPHAYLGTERPLDLWLFRLHGRLMAGRLFQSDFSPITEGEPDRLATAGIVVLVPRGVPGLEIGYSRFIHTRWPEGDFPFDLLLEPFSGVFNAPGSDRNPGGEEAQNQLAAAFIRWTVPSAGFEVWGEFVREDFALELRRFIEDPEDISGFTLGLQKVFERPAARRLDVVRLEWVNARTPHSDRDIRGPSTPLYQHSVVRQGHTHDGQLLGSPAAYGGAGLTAGWDRYTPDGRWTVELRRMERGSFFRARQVATPNVLYSVRAERVWFRNDFELLLGVEPAIELNRHLEDGSEDFNLNVSLGARWR